MTGQCPLKIYLFLNRKRIAKNSMFYLLIHFLLESNNTTSLNLKTELFNNNIVFFFSYTNHNNIEKHLLLYFFFFLWKNRNVKCSIIKNILIQVHFIFSSLLLKDWNVSIIIFINIKFCIAKIILLKCHPHQAKNAFLTLQ